MCQLIDLVQLAEVAEGDSLPEEEVVSATTVSGQEEIMVVGEVATVEMNSETRESSPDDLGVQLDAMGKEAISELTKTEVEGEEVVRVEQTALPFLAEQLKRKKRYVDNFFDSKIENELYHLLFLFSSLSLFLLIFGILATFECGLFGVWLGKW